MILYLIRGLPGSGKSTLARKLVGEQHICEADAYFYLNGEYKFDPTKLSQAHQFCLATCAAKLAAKIPAVAVANTFTQHWEMAKYYELAGEAGYEIQQIICKGPWGSVHNVPKHTIMKMQERFEY